MAYRIVKDTYKYDCIKYRVETNNGLFGLRKRFDKWKTVVVYNSRYGRFAAEFSSLKEAEMFVEEQTDCLVESEVIATYV